tara:strand:- start:3091 stop:3675 length:585 start_codon:yes stop_codon:yes gene_type:complete
MLRVRGDGMDIEARQRVEPELESGERILWTGRPDARALGWHRGGVQMLMMIPWLGFVAVWTWVATFVMPPEVSFGQFGLALGGIFVIVGTYYLIQAVLIVFGPSTTLYALTDQRVIISDGPRKATSHPPHALLALTRRGSDERGDLLFARGGWQHTGKYMSWVVAPGLIGIDNPRQVEGLIRQHLLTDQAHRPS